MHQVDLAQKSDSVLPIHNQEGSYGIAFDAVEMNVYWSGMGHDMIKRDNINGTDRKSISQACGSSKYFA